jgi:hypothetical protein
MCDYKIRSRYSTDRKAEVHNQFNIDDDDVYLAKITTWHWVIKSVLCIFQRKNTQTQQKSNYFFFVMA